MINETKIIVFLRDIEYQMHKKCRKERETKNTKS